MNTAVISLTQGQFAIIDEKNLDLINQYKWQAKWDSGIQTFYVKTAITDSNTGKQKTIYMHRLIMNATDSKIIIDHINHNTLDNTESNLRIVTSSQNHMNQHKRFNATSKYKGVCFRKARNKWIAQITKDQKTTFLGQFDSETQAAIAYNKAAVKLFGEFALLNEVL